MRMPSTGLRLSDPGIRISNYHWEDEARMRRKMKDEEVNRIVGQIDSTRRDLFSMSNVDDAPKARAFRKREKEDPRITRAKSRLRMAAWRKRNAESRRATTDQVVRSMLLALVTSQQSDLQPSDRNLIGRVLVDLDRRGFDLHAAKSSLRKLRNDIVPPADRAGESADNSMF